MISKEQAWCSRCSKTGELIDLQSILLIVIYLSYDFITYFPREGEGEGFVDLKTHNGLLGDEDGYKLIKLSASLLSNSTRL